MRYGEKLQAACHHRFEKVSFLKAKYHTTIRTAKALGIVAMMHGYLPFDKRNQLVPSEHGETI